MAADPGVDRMKVQEEIKQLQDQLLSISSSSSFAGENWLIGHPDVKGYFYTGPTSRTDYPLLDGNKRLVASFTRDSAGNVAIRTVELERTVKDVVFAPARYEPGAPVIGVQTGYGIADSPIEYEAMTLPDNIYGHQVSVALVDYQSSWERLSDELYTDGTDFYARVDGFFLKAEDASGKIDTTNTTASYRFDPDVTVASLDITRLDRYSEQFVGTEAPLEFGLDVLISFVDQKLQNAVDVTAKYGAISKRLELQDDFASSLSDSLERGVGRLVDANLNETSTRLKALQMQQQLAVQSLSIANSDAQNVVSLFR